MRRVRTAGEPGHSRVRSVGPYPWQMWHPRHHLLLVAMVALWVVLAYVSATAHGREAVGWGVVTFVLVVLCSMGSGDCQFPTPRQNICLLGFGLGGVVLLVNGFYHMAAWDSIQDWVISHIGDGGS